MHLDWRFLTDASDRTAVAPTLTRLFKQLLRYRTRDSTTHGTFSPTADGTFSPIGKDVEAAAQSSGRSGKADPAAPLTLPLALPADTSARAGNSAKVGNVGDKLAYETEP
jgi:hypothetical protein